MTNIDNAEATGEDPRLKQPVVKKGNRLAAKDATPPESGGFDLHVLQAEKRRRDAMMRAAARGEIEGPELTKRRQTPQPEGFDRKGADLTTAPEVRHPNENPVQPVGSTHDASGRQFHGVQQPPGPVEWVPNGAPANTTAKQPVSAADAFK